jgi:hypothetical protein
MWRRRMAQLLTAATFASRQDHSSERVPSKFGRRRGVLCSAVRVANEDPTVPRRRGGGHPTFPRKKPTVRGEAGRTWAGDGGLKLSCKASSETIPNIGGGAPKKLASTRS